MAVKSVCLHTNDAMSEGHFDAYFGVYHHYSYAHCALKQRDTRQQLTYVGRYWRD